MSQNNSNDNAVAGGIIGLLSAVAIGFVFVILALIAAGFLILCFLALLFTLISVFAWNRPIYLWRLSIEPEDAREFITKGLIGGGLAAGFVVFLAILFALGDGGQIPLILIPYAFVFGYVAGSVGLAFLFEEDGAINSPIRYSEHTYRRAIDVTPPAHALPPPPAQIPFRYASWDDEEGSQ
ncbi:hypothetical protein GC173_02995 [bacterium]|nr:hypothetical protein [bacterium]